VSNSKDIVSGGAITNDSSTIQPALLTIPNIYKLMNISRTEFYKLNASGKFAPLSVE
jgi:hypothetical protein